MITNKNGKSMKKAEIVGYLSEKDAEKIQLAIEHIQENEELQRVANFENYCAFVLQKIKEESQIEKDSQPATARARMQYRKAYDGYIKKLKVIIENHGIPRKGHLDDEAAHIIHLLESDNYKHLLEIHPAVRESYGIVKNHKHEPKHLSDYERRLNHLHEALSYAQKERTLEGRMKV